jgi:hypothetical protein
MTASLSLNQEGSKVEIEWSEVFIPFLYTNSNIADIDKRLFDVALIKIDTLDKNFEEFKNNALPLANNIGSSLGQNFSVYGKSNAGICYNHGTVNTISRGGLLQFVGMPPADRYSGLYTIFYT